MPSSVVCLGGFMCSGKTSVGRVLAARLGRDFIDTDRRGVVVTTGIQAIVVDPDAEVTYSAIDPDQEGPTLALVVTIQFILMHGEC